VSKIKEYRAKDALQNEKGQSDLCDLFAILLFLRHKKKRRDNAKDNDISLEDFS